ncbi:MFS transporter [Brevundimonas lenta]|uniref:MFS family permease n=1 Tax=Brevundimonas lenta TaxID=424796 RepID=A0A7W6NPE8_9CAUL|nr:MFS transporter [Brevundimonas lenta]MBB4082459.1 MFS family permease [Brevundimonas lenta]
MPSDAAVPAPTAEVRPTRTALGLILLALTIASGAAMQGSFSPVQEFAKADMGLSDLQISMVQGLAASIPVAVLSIPLGWLVDHTTRVRILIAMAVVWTLGTLGTAFADSFGLLFVARMLAGLGATCCLPVAISIAADLCLPHRRGRSLLLLTMGKVGGQAGAFAIGGMLFSVLAASTAAPLFGLTAWRATHVWFAVGSAALILPLFFLAEPTRKEVSKPGAALGISLQELWERRRFLAPLFIGQVGVVMADVSAGVWAAPVLMRNYGLQPADFAGWMGLAFLVAGVFGAVLGGFAADWGHKRYPGKGILIGAVIASGLSIPMALFPIMPQVAGFGVLLSLLLLCGTIAGLITATAIAVLVPNEIRGLCLGAFVVIGALVGLGVAPTAVTLGSTLLGGEDKLGLALTITGVATSILAFVAFFMAWRAAPKSASDAV